MNAVTRWKTIATIAVAFSAGNLFATACQNGGGGKANAEVSAADLASLATALVATEADVANIKCVLRYLEDSDQDGRTNNFWLEEYHVAAANSACGI